MWMKLEKLCYMKKAQKVTYDSIYMKYLEQVSPLRQKRLVTARGWKEKAMERNCLMGMGFCFETWWWLHNIVNELIVTKFFILKWLIL